MKVNLEIWASGGGTNADAIASYFANHPSIKVSQIICNRKQAGVFDVAKRHGIQADYWGKEDWEAVKVLSALKERQTDLIILAGFLKLVPAEVVKAYEGRILNIHPSLLPKYGGKNMYGDHVHKAVLAHNEKQSGITIHEVNEEFDKGKIIAQFTVPVPATLDELKASIHSIEHRYFAPTIEAFVKDRLL